MSLAWRRNTRQREINWNYEGTLSNILSCKTTCSLRQTIRIRVTHLLLFFSTHGLAVENTWDDFSNGSHDFGPLPFLMNTVLFWRLRSYLYNVSGGSGLSDSRLSPHVLEIFLLVSAATISNYRHKSSRASSRLVCVSSWSTCSPGQCFQNNLTWVGGHRSSWHKEDCVSKERGTMSRAQWSN